MFKENKVHFSKMIVDLPRQIMVFLVTFQLVICFIYLQFTPVNLQSCIVLFVIAEAHVSK